MMIEPEAATDVFAVAARTGASGDTPTWVSGFVTDMTIQIEAALANKTVGTRQLGGNVMYTDANNAEGGGGGKYTWDYMTGFSNQAGAYAPNKELMWKRAKGYMDVVCYTGNGTNPQDVHHSLSVIPEMVWHKKRSATSVWKIWHKDAQAGGDEDDGLQFDNGTIRADAFYTINITGNSDYIRMGSSGSNFNGSGITYVAYLFASLDGISKVGSYTGTGSDINVDCGFSAGARFILIKRTDATGDWYLYDTARGIVAGADPFLKLNTNEAQDAGNDGIDPLSSGFIVTSSSGNNTSGGNYIFYAIA
jgi:hypothetical protein